MALIQLGGLITSIRGSIRGFTFQETLAGTVVRARSGTYKSVSQKCNIINASINNYIRQWNTLGTELQGDWNDFGAAHDFIDKWGRTKTLNGWNWFYQINYYRVLYGQAMTNTPPVYTIPEALPTYTLICLDDSFTLNYDSGIIPVNTGFILFTAYPNRRRSTPLRSALRLTKLYTECPLLASNFTSEWESTHNLTLPLVDADFFVQALLVPVEQTSFISGAGSQLIVIYPT